MSTDIIDEEIVDIIKINTETAKLYKKVESEFKKYADDPNNKELLKCLKNKYYYLGDLQLVKELILPIVKHIYMNCLK